MPDFANITGNPKSTARQNLSTTNRATQSQRKSSSLLSSSLLKVLSTLLFFALLATVWYAVSQTLEVEKLRASTKSLNEDAMELKRQINDKAKAMQQKTIENERKSRELEESRSKSQELERQVSELQRALAASPGKEDHAILLSLRNAVNSYIDTQKLSLQALKDAVSPVPQSPTRPEN